MTIGERKLYRYTGKITVHSFDDNTDCYNVVFGRSGRTYQIPREEFDRDYEIISSGIDNLVRLVSFLPYLEKFARDSASWRPIAEAPRDEKREMLLFGWNGDKEYLTALGEWVGTIDSGGWIWSGNIPPTHFMLLDE